MTAHEAEKLRQEVADLRAIVDRLTDGASPHTLPAFPDFPEEATIAKTARLLRCRRDFILQGVRVGFIVSVNELGQRQRIKVADAISWFRNQRRREPLPIRDYIKAYHRAAGSPPPSLPI